MTAVIETLDTSRHVVRNLGPYGLFSVEVCEDDLVFIRYRDTDLVGIFLPSENHDGFSLEVPTRANTREVVAEGGDTQWACGDNILIELDDLVKAVDAGYADRTFASLHNPEDWQRAVAAGNTRLGYDDWFKTVKDAEDAAAQGVSVDGR